MDGWIGGWGRGWPAARRQPDPRAEAAPRARPRGCFGLQTLPFPSSPASVPSPRSPSTRSHPPAYHIPTNTHTMDNASTQDNQKHNLTIIKCWLSTQPREPFSEKTLRVCGHWKGGGGHNYGNDCTRRTFSKKGSLGWVLSQHCIIVRLCFWLS